MFEFVNSVWFWVFLFILWVAGAIWWVHQIFQIAEKEDENYDI